MCNCRFRCCCCPCCCCRPRRPGGPGGIGPGGPGGPGGVRPGNDICAGVRRRAYRKGFRNGYWAGFNDASFGRGPGGPGSGDPRDGDGCGCDN